MTGSTLCRRAMGVDALRALDAVAPELASYASVDALLEDYLAVGRFCPWGAELVSIDDRR